MGIRGGPRPGGRSARVQASIHGAAETLLAKVDRAAITIPMIAGEAGVTPSTIYRRWGDLQELFADIAVKRLRPDTEPSDTGDGGTDLKVWAEQYAEEMSSGPGREMIRDVLAAQNGAGQCCVFTREQIAIIAARARSRGENFPDTDTVMDCVVSPIMYRILFAEPADPGRIGELVAGVMRRARPVGDQEPG